jgi:hypothetical protein
MQIHQSSLSYSPVSIAQKKSGDIKVSDPEKKRIEIAPATQDVAAQHKNNIEGLSSLSTIEIGQARNIKQMSAINQAFKQQNLPLNAQSLKAISAYINERNQPEYDRLESLVGGFDIIV